MEPTQTAHQVHLIEPHIVIATCENIMSSRSTSTRDVMTQQKQALIIAKLVRPNSLEPDLTPYISTQQISPSIDNTTTSHQNATSKNNASLLRPHCRTNACLPDPHTIPTSIRKHRQRFQPREKGCQGPCCCY